MDLAEFEDTVFVACPGDADTGFLEDDLLNFLEVL